MAYAPKTYTTIVGRIVGQSPKAIKFCITDTDPPGQTEWFPLSQISKLGNNTSQHEDEMGDKYDELLVSDWILKEKKLFQPQGGK